MGTHQYVVLLITSFINHLPYSVSITDQENKVTCRMTTTEVCFIIIYPNIKHYSTKSTNHHQWCKEAPLDLHLQLPDLHLLLPLSLLL